MDVLSIERLGGLAGFGGGRLKSAGEHAFSALSPADQAAVEGLFKALSGKAPPPAAHPDGFRYRITRQTASGPQSIEAPEDAVPAALKNAVKDQLF